LKKLLAEGAHTLAYSYIGPNYLADYRDGTIGRAKKDLERAAAELDETLAAKPAATRGFRKPSGSYAGLRRNSRRPALFEFASAGHEEKRIDEGPLEQMRRLFSDFISSAARPNLDEPDAFV